MLLGRDHAHIKYILCFMDWTMPILSILYVCKSTTKVYKQYNGFIECVSRHPDTIFKILLPEPNDYHSESRSQSPDMFYLDPVHRGIPAIKQPWPECQSDFSDWCHRIVAKIQDYMVLPLSRILKVTNKKLKQYYYKKKQYNYIHRARPPPIRVR